MYDRSIASLFRPGVSAVIATEAMSGMELWPEEQTVIARAVAKRCREFTAGRACARAALGHFGIVSTPIPSGRDRAPVWPTGFVGSITHCDGFCAAVVARNSTMRGLGLDAEPAIPLEPELMQYICTASERDQLAVRPELTPGMWGKLIFSAKEAFYKSYFQVTQTSLDFCDVVLTFDTPEPGEGHDQEASFKAEIIAKEKPLSALASTFTGRWRIEGGYVLTGGCW